MPDKPTVADPFTPTAEERRSSLSREEQQVAYELRQIRLREESLARDRAALEARFAAVGQLIAAVG